MASICLFDIDFLYGSKFVPNLELMKVFNYYYQEGHVINLGQKKENLDRYNQIIFFKDSPHISVPRGLDLSGENKQIYGYGFYNRFIPLSDKYTDMPPNYLCYDIFNENIKNLKKYENIKNGNLVRIENEDFSNFSQDKKTFYIVDRNFSKLDNAYSFIKEYYRNYQFEFLHQQRYYDKETFEKFFPYVTASNRPIINFDFDINFFKKYYNEKVIFTIDFKEKETQKGLLKRIISMILFSKQNNHTLYLINDLKVNTITKKQFPLIELLQLLVNWAASSKNISFYDFTYITDKNKSIIELSKEYSYVRLLLKQNPKTFNSQDFDF